MITLKSNSLFAKKMFNVKCNNTTKDEIVAAIPMPNFPYANKHIGIPILPVLGKIKGGNSLIKSFFINIRKISPINPKEVKRINA